MEEVSEENHRRKLAKFKSQKSTQNAKIIRPALLFLLATTNGIVNQKSFIQLPLPERLRRLAGALKDPSWKKESVVLDVSLEEIVIITDYYLQIIGKYIGPVTQELLGKDIIISNELSEQYIFETLEIGRNLNELQSKAQTKRKKMAMKSVGNWEAIFKRFSKGLKLCSSWIRRIFGLSKAPVIKRMALEIHIYHFDGNNLDNARRETAQQLKRKMLKRAGYSLYKEKETERIHWTRATLEEILEDFKNACELHQAKDILVSINSIGCRPYSNVLILSDMNTVDLGSVLIDPICNDFRNSTKVFLVNQEICEFNVQTDAHLSPVQMKSHFPYYFIVNSSETSSNATVEGIQRLWGSAYNFTLVVFLYHVGEIITLRDISHAAEIMLTSSEWQEVFPEYEINVSKRNGVLANAYNMCSSNDLYL